jgi:hypothetical protein
MMMMMMKIIINWTSRTGTFVARFTFPVNFIVYDQQGFRFGEC